MFPKGGGVAWGAGTFFKANKSRDFEVKLLLPAKTWLVGWEAADALVLCTVAFPPWKNHPLDRGKPWILIFRGSN